jgi:hypothetical protein
MSHQFSSRDIDRLIRSNDRYRDSQGCYFCGTSPSQVRQNPKAGCRVCAPDWDERHDPIEGEIPSMEELLALKAEHEKKPKQWKHFTSWKEFKNYEARK